MPANCCQHLIDPEADQTRKTSLRQPPIGKSGSGTLAFLTADLRDSASGRNSLIAYGWTPSRPTLLVLEGSTYCLRRVFSALSTQV